MIKNVIFDLGNVLIDFKPLEYLYERIPEKQRADRIYEEIFKSEEWPMLDRGLITEAEAMDRICGRDSDNCDIIREVMDDWYQMLTPIKGTVDILKGLKLMGYKLYFLSNYHLLAFEYVSGKYEFFMSFDGGIVSYREKLLKPEREIYDKLITTYGVKPEESVFIDDTEENIKGAQAAGFKTVLFTTAHELREKLAGYGVFDK